MSMITDGCPATENERSSVAVALTMFATTQNSRSRPGAAGLIGPKRR